MVAAAAQVEGIFSIKHRLVPIHGVLGSYITTELDQHRHCITQPLAMDLKHATNVINFMDANVRDWHKQYLISLVRHKDSL